MADPRQLKALVLKALHQNFQFNIFQLELGKELFQKNTKTIFVRCGRKCGKTEGAIYSMWRWAMLNAGSCIYYLGPQKKQIKEILWDNNRLLGFGPKEFVRHVDNQELRITFKNDSFIKVDGSDNFDNWAGITPDLVFYDEFRSFKPQAHEVMNPNRAPRNAPLVIMGSPPPQLMVDKDTPHQYVKMWKQAVKNAETGKAAALHFPSWVNDKCPGLIKWMMEEKEELYAAGEEDVWKREYGAEFVESSIVSIFPQPYVYDEAKLVRPRAEFLPEIYKYASDYEWYAVADPSSTTCFGVLFIAFHPAKQMIYVIDEIYEKLQQNMSVQAMWPRIYDTCRAIYPRFETWNVIYDEAAAWFFNEVMANFDPDSNGQTKAPTSFFNAIITSLKKSMNKEDGIGLLKDTFRNCQVVIAQECEALRWEIKNYSRDKNGKISKTNDHLLDDLRYLQQHVNFTSVDRSKEPKDTGYVFDDGRVVQSPEEDSLLVPELSDNEFLLDIY